MIKTENFPSAEDMEKGRELLAKLKEHAMCDAEELAILESIGSDDEIALLGLVARTSALFIEPDALLDLVLEEDEAQLFRSVRNIKSGAMRQTALALQARNEGTA